MSKDKKASEKVASRRSRRVQGPLPPEMMKSALSNDHKKPQAQHQMPQRSQAVKEGEKPGVPPRKQSDHDDNSTKQVFIAALAVLMVGIVYIKFGSDKKVPKGTKNMALKEQVIPQPGQTVTASEVYAQKVLQHKVETQRKMEMRRAETEVRNYYDAPRLKEEDIGMPANPRRLGYTDAPDMSQNRNAALDSVANSKAASMMDPEQVIINEMRQDAELHRLNEAEKDRYLKEFKANARAGGWIVDADIVGGELIVKSYKPIPGFGGGRSESTMGR